MAESQHLNSQYFPTALSELDCLEDPRGGAVAWALLVVAATLIASVTLIVL
ncbi:MAG TPA: hypothetical protein VJT72_17730 [Pseudonocardiaceae bacterium]|nr:hypothetical protein [Pseudonocardiaceae bacterium]